MNAIIEYFKNNDKIKKCLEKIEKKTSPISILGLTDVVKVCLVNTINECNNQKILIITYNELQAKKMYKDIKYFQNKVEFLPKKETVTYEYIAQSKDTLYERIDILNKLNTKDIEILITTIEALMQPVISKKELYENIIKFKVGKSYDLEEIKQKLVYLGYERADLTEGRGQFSLRGDILDIATEKNTGIRVEFWGDEIDSIRRYNISSQRSIDNIKQVTINPAQEYILEKNDDGTVSVKNGTSDLLEYLDDFLTVIDEPSKIEARAENIKKDNQLLIKSIVEKGKQIPWDIENLKSDEEIINKITTNQHVILERQDASKYGKNAQRLRTREVVFSRSNIESFIEETKIREKDKTVVVLAGNEENSKKIQEILLDNSISYKFLYELENLDSEKVNISLGGLSSGFECYDLGLIVITGEELFTGETRRRQVSSAFSKGEKVVFSDLKIGDFVVHKTNGIGQFIGVNTIKADGVVKDYIKIRYKGDDILYVPTNSLDNVRKYIGVGSEASPKLNRLGSKEWLNTKNKVKNNLREVAQNLIELYAKRQKIKGFAFSPDTPWQSQFEEEFPYVETDDQLRCIEEVKKSMEEPRPMDRLLCGDVGYGKTEVAIRGAFKACMDQKQVAYLVPTTVLANQQYESFRDRMKNFPIRVELLNRFRTKKEQEEVVKKLKLGEVDIVIGTHRILSKDVEFKDLGLLIIDEEHRFGVKDKEKIKELKNTVDVLTMTATPIPRTLHMSIVGVRDMSVIYEPPQNRRPVQTYVLEYDEEVIKEAITKELERDGQVFYLYNKVETIIRKKEEIEKLVPEAKVSFAHGKMSGRELENIMQDFVDGKSNVLVCTTILESGIDIPNANTIIVEDADRLGLAQLYQIRGRVGRSDKQAYAYVTYRRNKVLTEESEKRLKAIKEFTEFGSGFKIAMRDLEIRGAGSLLGEIQHGHMEQVGYDTYCKLLDEVVKEMQGVQVEEEQDVQIDINVSSYIPDEYIESGPQKIEIYQDIALCRTEEDIQNVIDEIIDRYGNMPKEVENLLEIARIKELCKKKNILKIAQKRESIVFSFEASKFNMEIVDSMIKEYRNKIKFSPGSIPYITLKVDSNEEKKVIKEIKEFLCKL